MSSLPRWKRRQVLAAGSAAALWPLLSGCKTGIDAQSFDHAEVLDFAPDAIPAHANAFPQSAQVGDLTASQARIIAFPTAGDAVFRLFRRIPKKSNQVAWVQDEPAGTGERSELQLTSLAPATRYHYGYYTPDFSMAYATGSFVTAPPDDWMEPLTVAATSCTKFAYAPYTALERMAETQPDLFVHLGDIVYNDNARTPGALEENWLRTLSDPGYRALLSSCGWLQTWDDHEVDNNWDPETLDPERFREAKAAYLKYTTAKDTEGHIWQSQRWGQVAEFFQLDCRSERKPSTVASPDAEYMSDRQLNWLFESLVNSTAVFKVLMSSVPMTWFDSPFWATQHDRWQGYAAQRTKLLDGIRARGIQGVVVLAGDFHLGFVGRLASSGPDSSIWEIAAGPGGNQGNPLAAFLDPANSSPAIRDEVFPPSQILYASGDIAGTLLTFEPKKKTVSVRFIDHVTGATRFEQTLQVDGPTL